MVYLARGSWRTVRVKLKRTGVPPQDQRPMWLNWSLKSSTQLSAGCRQLHRPIRTRIWKDTCHVSFSRKLRINNLNLVWIQCRCMHVLRPMQQGILTIRLVCSLVVITRKHPSTTLLLGEWTSRRGEQTPSTKVRALFRLLTKKHECVMVLLSIKVHDVE